MNYRTLEPPPDRPWGRTLAILGAIVTVLVVAAVLWLCYQLRTVALLVVLSIFFAYLLAPIVAMLETPFRLGGKTRALSRTGAIALVYSTGALMIGLALFLGLPRVAHQLGQLDQALPSFLGGQRGFTDTLLDEYRSWHLPPALRNALDQAGHQALDTAHAKGREALAAAVGLLNFLPWLVLIPVIAVFLLKDATAFTLRVLGLLPEGRVRWRGREFFEDVNQTIAFYVRAQLIACAFIGAVCTLGFLAIRVPYALLLGVMAAMLEMIPLIGPILTATIAGLVAGTHGPETAVYTVLFLVVLRVVHDNVVYPRLIASGIKLHPLMVILALLCGGQLGGGVGLFLAIPLTAFLSVTLRHLSRQWRGDGLFTAIFRAQQPEPVPTPPVKLDGKLPLPRAGERLPLEGVRVLAVDDDEDGRLLLAGLLERQGAQVETVSSAAEALGALRAGKFDVLLSDIGMPGEDGFELIRKVRALEELNVRDVPAVALTGYDTEEDRERVRASGFTRHLGKPIDATELLSTVIALAAMAKGALVHAEPRG